MKLRLLLTEECNRSCRKCCNKLHDLNALPVCTTLTGWEEVIITGGEPLLYPARLGRLIGLIRAATTAPIFIYTAWAKDAGLLREVIDLVDGITLTIHTSQDTEPFKALCALLRERPPAESKSLRLNVFGRISTGGEDLSLWKVRRGLRWLDDCPVPENEVLMRWAGAEALREAA